MKFKMSPNVAIRTQGQFAEAVDFYTKVLGFQNRSDDPDLGDLDAILSTCSYSKTMNSAAR